MYFLHEKYRYNRGSIYQRITTFFSKIFKFFMGRRRRFEIKIGLDNFQVEHQKKRLLKTTWISPLGCRDHKYGLGIFQFISEFVL